MKSPGSRSRRGFTLLEVIIVVAIIGVLMGGAVMAVGALTGSQAKASATELAGTIRLVYDSAALTGRTCRLVFDLPSAKDDDSPVKYRAECAKAGLTARKDRDEELREADSPNKDRNKRKSDEDKRFRSLSSDSTPSAQELAAREKQRVEDSAKYDTYTNEEIVERTLPSSVRLSIWTKHQREPTKQGTAFLYFFPQGFTERSYIYVRQGNNVWTLTVSSLTGKVVVVPEELEVPRA